jgi:hypothetical protein
LIEVGQKIKEKKKLMQEEKKALDLAECTFIPMTNSKRHNMKKKVTKEVLQVEQDMFNEVMMKNQKQILEAKKQELVTENQNAARMAKLRKTLNTSSAKSLQNVGRPQDLKQTKEVS